ncbi:DUF3846 domain-containing protein [Pseudonocardia sp. H11422]|uniref:DUF3846 domain-containing protein n=1 Tax=Pseudonocardia sp. H11422 TaxID=2835866 RepID=UPI001BDDA651|nr:DUF3846 domain-containing protein [Pseudonocardia sp. H11422]
MNETATIKVMTIAPNGDLSDVELPSGNVLQGLYSAIGCHCVDLLRLTDTLDMWVDDDGLMNGSAVNMPATAVAHAFGWTHQIYAGTVVLAEHSANGDTVSLRPELRAAVRGILGA